MGDAGEVGTNVDLDKDKTEDINAQGQDDLRPEYGEAELIELLSNGVRGKYVERTRILSWEALNTKSNKQG